MPQTVGWRHEPTQQTSLSNLELEAIQRGPQSSWLFVNLDGQAHDLVCRCQRQKRGRSPKFSDAAIQLCLTLKNLFGLALRQTTGLVESGLQLCGLTWPVPDFRTLCRRQRDLNAQIPYSLNKAGLHLLVDSTGIKFLGEGEWKCKKHGAKYRRQWRKLHIGINADTLQIRAICVTSNNVSDASVLSDLLAQLPPDEASQDALLAMVPTTHSLPTKRPSGMEPFPSFLLARMLESAKGRCLGIAILRLPRAGAGPKNLEALDWLPPAKLGEN